MTTAKRVGLASVVLVSLGASAAYYATMMALRGYQVRTRGLDYLVLGLVAALTILLLAVFWRSIYRGFKSIAAQLDKMAREEKIGMVMVDKGEELEQITMPLNRFLTSVQENMKGLQSRNRELHIQSRLAEAENRHTQAIILSISDAVIVTNRFDELILANDAAEKLLGFKLAHSLRRNIDHVIHDLTLIRLIRQTRSGGRDFARKVVEHTFEKAGQASTYMVTLSCVTTPDGEGHVSGVVAVMHDVTREREIAQMKTDFVSSVSHELRTPLSSIKAYVEMLLDGEARDRKTQREFCEIIAGEADRLTRLIDNILNISRIESGGIRSAREPLCLADVAGEVVELLSAQARAKGIRLVSGIEPAPEQVEADRDMIHQAVLNLVGNALKYTLAGGEVAVTAGIDRQRQVAVCEVSDTGVGIRCEDLPHIFDKFYRAGGHTKMAKGTGLGLTLAKRIVETVHDGHLSATSQPGQGSSFRLELPLAQ